LEEESRSPFITQRSAEAGGRRRAAGEWFTEQRQANVMLLRAKGVIFVAYYYLYLEEVKASRSILVVGRLTRLTTS